MLFVRTGIFLFLQKERRKKWDEKNQEAITEAVKQLDEFDKVLHLYTYHFIDGQRNLYEVQVSILYCICRD